jgi:hypothetical protein
VHKTRPQYQAQAGAARAETAERTYTMTGTESGDLQRMIFYEPAHDGSRQFVGSFPNLRAARAYLEGGNLPDTCQCAGALPMLPPAH